MPENVNTERPSYGEGLDALRRAAMAVATETGLSGLTIRGVAERAKVTHGLVRHHFGSRDGLIASTVDEAVGRTLYLEGEGATALSERIDATHGELRIQYELMLRGGYPAAIQEAYARYRAEAAQWLGREGIDADHPLVQVVVALLDGLALQRLALGDEVDADQALEEFIRLLDRAP